MKAKKIHFFCVLTVLFVIAAYGQESTLIDESGFQSRLEQAMIQLSRNAGPGQIGAIESSLAEWRRTRSRETFTNLTDQIYRVSRDSRTISKVTITASRGEGAVVKYQTYGQRERNEEPTRTNGLTTAEEILYMGLYYIWSERDGSPTSDINSRFVILRSSAKIELSEAK